MRNLKLILQYNGHGFVGYQKQAQGTSIQEVVEHALFRLTGEQIAIRAAGRTDAGVHALGQAISFHTHSSLSIHTIVHGTNAHLPSSIAVIHAEEVADSFDARHSASGKLYRYQIWNGRTRVPFFEGTHYHIRTPLHVDAMRAAAIHLCGEHDFRAFRASDCQRLNTVRIIRDIRIFSIEHQTGQELAIEVEGTAFLKNMVRIFAGTLIHVGLSKLSPESIPTILTGLDRTKAGPTAPSHGLFLCRVDYHARTP